MQKKGNNTYEIESKQTIEKISGTKSWVFEKDQYN